MILAIGTFLKPFGLAASHALQVGVQKFGYALFFMTDSSLAYLKKSGG